MKNGARSEGSTFESKNAARPPRPALTSVYLCAGCQHPMNYDPIADVYFARGRAVVERAIIAVDEVCLNCSRPPTSAERDEFVKKDLELRLLRAAVAKAEGAPQESPAVPAVRQKNPTAEKMLLTKRAAVRALGIDRAKFYELIREGRIAVVEINGRERIARSEIERIMLQGVPSADARSTRYRATRKSPRRSSRGRGASAGSQGDAIRALKV